ncbi:alpha/beta fold hydrolase [Amycolatopsis sp. w19]|uniref:alpha/beta fold hydrolase n=1 Tax=Amycolatopsis sp. w19 TaxID=3448134 RepID=UPI003F1BA555
MADVSSSEVHVSNSSPQATVILARHFEVQKNSLNIHGTTTMQDLTDRGLLQVEALARSIEDSGYRPVSVRPAPVAYCAKSAALLADRLGIPIGRPLGLQPYSMGILDGLSADQVEDRFPGIASRIEQFRLRITDATRLQIPEAESMQSLESRIRKWWAVEGSALSGAVLMLTRSTLLMVHAALHRTYPSTGRYLDLALPNGGGRIVKLEKSSNGTASAIRTWPANVTKLADYGQGHIAYTTWEAAYFRRTADVIIVPGLFGNNRTGPYNLYSTIAAQLSAAGYRSTVYDPVGSGESVPLPRSYEGDVESLVSVARALKVRRAILIGHSVGATVAAAVGDRIGVPCHTIALAPITTAAEVLRRINADDRRCLERSIAIRNGVRFKSDYASLLQKASRDARFDAVVVGDSDTYLDPSAPVLWSHKSKTMTVKGDHNFTATIDKVSLFASLLDLAAKCHPGWHLEV